MLVTHGGVLRLIATRAGAAIDELIPNLGGYWFACNGRGWPSPSRIAPLAADSPRPPTDLPRGRSSHAPTAPSDGAVRAVYDPEPHHLMVQLAADRAEGASVRAESA